MPTFWTHRPRKRISIFLYPLLGAFCTGAAGESVVCWEIKIRVKHHCEYHCGYLWLVDMCFWRAFLDLQCFPHMLQKWSLLSMWWPSMCFLMLIFWSVFPQATQVHLFPSTFFINFPISISRSSSPSWKVTPDLFPAWAVWKSWITDKMPPGLISFCASTILFSPHAFIMSLIEENFAGFRDPAAFQFNSWSSSQTNS